MHFKEIIECRCFIAFKVLEFRSEKVPLYDEIIFFSFQLLGLYFIRGAARWEGAMGDFE